MDDHQEHVSDPLPTVPNPTILHRRRSQETGDRSTKRARASKPKVKSGCATCKIRRIKCDETKPQCLRCQKLGRVCEGYATTPVPPRGPIQIQPRLSSPTLYRPSVSINITENESRYFQVFVEHAAHELSGYFNSTFWSHVALQESHEVPAIRHAIISLGALNKSISIAPPPSLKINVIQTLEKHHHEQAVLHYHKSIQLLNQYISDSRSPQLRTALIACILFVCFETIQGSFSSSIQQTYGGLKLLRSYYRGRAPPEGNAQKSTDLSGQDPEGIDRNESDAVISAQVRDYFESDAWHEAPVLSLSPTTNQREISNQPLVQSQPKYQTWQADYIPQPPTLMSNHTKLGSQERQPEHMNQNSAWSQDSLQFQFQVGAVDFREPDYHNEMAQSSAKQVSTGYDQHLSAQPYLTSSRKRSHSQELNQQPPRTRQLSDTSFMGAEYMKYRSMSTVSLNDNSSAYSSDSSSSYREPSPHHLQPTTNTGILRRSSLSTSFSQLEYNPSISSSETTRTPPYRPTQPTLQRTLEIEDSIIQTFVRLDGPGIFFGMAPGIPVIYWDTHKIFHLSIPSSFSSYDSAQRCWDFLMDRALHFYSTTLYNRLHKPRTLSNDSAITCKHKSFEEEIAAFQKSFQPLLATASCSNTLHAPTLLISLYINSTSILLAQTTSPSEMTYDTFLPEFDHIVSTCSLILTIPSQNPSTHTSDNTNTNINENNSSRFSFSIGIIPPLHLTATKCRDPHIRRKAIELLFRSQRQEGLWDGILCGRIGRWVSGCEEDGMEGFDVSPASNKEKMGERERRGDDQEYDGMRYIGKQKVEEKDTKMMTLPQRSRNSIQINLPTHPKTTAFNTDAYPNLKPKPSQDKGKGKEKQKQKWIIPLENRTQLTSISFHIPDRYIKVKCQRVGGEREVRETVIAW